MKAIITSSIVKSQKVCISTVEKIKKKDKICKKCKTRNLFCEAECKNFWLRNEKVLLTRAERRKK